MKQAKRIKRWRYYLRRFAHQIKILRVLQSISREKYDEKISASLVYGFLSAVAVNFFFQPGHVYSSGATGLAQIISALSNHWFGFHIPISLTFYAINFPLMVLAWYQIGHKFTVFTFITVSMSSFFIQFVPVATLTEDPIINALFGGVVDNLMSLDKTLIFIAHRLTIAERTEKVVVLDQGKIIEEGKHADLLAQGGFYAHLVNS